MHVDLSRNSFDRSLNFTRVLMQQGRLIVDADWNEQNDIVQNYLRSLAADLIGWHGGPGVEKGASNEPTAGPLLVGLGADDKVSVSGGRYYVDGMLVDLPAVSNGYPAELANPNASALANRLVLVELWEQPVNGLADHRLLDPALNGLDTCARLMLRFRFRVLYTDLNNSNPQLTVPSEVNAFRRVLVKSEAAAPGVPLDSRPLTGPVLPNLAAWPKRDEHVRDDCDDQSALGFTGLENQLYRVEVHSAGANGQTFWDGSDVADNKSSAFSLKWSRENGSVMYAAEMGNGTATLRSKWRDDARAIHNDDWVELIGRQNERGILVRVIEVVDENGVLSIRFEAPKGAENGAALPGLGDWILVRRWDHRGRKQFPLWKGGVLVREETDAGVLAMLRDAKLLAANERASVPIPLEDNLYVRLSLPVGSAVRPGDYWLIPARATTGDILWPRAAGGSGMTSYWPVSASHSVRHYAPLALIRPGAGGPEIIDLRRAIVPIAG